jgi:protein TonB
MRITLLAAFLLLNTCLHAQDTTGIRHDSIPAKFNGGQNAWRHFLEKNLHPTTPADNGAKPGIYVVTISFLVDTTGKVSEVELLTDPGYGTGTDVLKAFAHTPNWIPATIDGRKVIYRQKQNFTYQVSEQ